jgi:hypothetical protein
MIERIGSVTPRVEEKVRAQRKPEHPRELQIAALYWAKRAQYKNPPDDAIARLVVIALPKEMKCSWRSVLQIAQKYKEFVKDAVSHEKQILTHNKHEEE